MSQTAHSFTPVVTIYEAYGAGADLVGRRVAEQLNLPYHAQAFTSAELEGDSAETENAAVLARVLSVMGGAYGGIDSPDIATTQRMRYELVQQNNRDVWRFADEGGVIVGRNAPVVLADRPNTVHVLLTGQVKDRVARAAAESGLALDAAAARQVREDEVRADMSITLYGWDPRLPERYDLVINTSRIPLDLAAEAIVHAVSRSID